MIRKTFVLNNFHFDRLKNELNNYYQSQFIIIDNYKLIKLSDNEFKFELINLSKDFSFILKIEMNKVNFKIVRIWQIAFYICILIDIILLIFYLKFFYIYSCIIIAIYLILIFQLRLHSIDVLNKLKIKTI